MGATLFDNAPMIGGGMSGSMDDDIAYYRLREQFPTLDADAASSGWKPDGRGNYTLGFREQTFFPEIDYDKIDKARGLEISISTTARTDEEGRQLLELLGMPFSKD